MDTLPCGNCEDRLQVRLGCIQLSPSCPVRLLHTCFLSPAREALPPRLDMAPLIQAPEGLEPSRTMRCSAHTIGLSDSRHGPLAVIYSRWRLPRVATPLPCRVSQVPRLICPCALPPLTPGSPATASTHCFLTGIVRLHPYPADWPLPSRNEAETGLLALRLAGSLIEASPNGLPRSTLDSLHVEWAITWWAPMMFCLLQTCRAARGRPTGGRREPRKGFAVARFPLSQ